MERDITCTISRDRWAPIGWKWHGEWQILVRDVAEAARLRQLPPDDLILEVVRHGLPGRPIPTHEVDYRCREILTGAEGSAVGQPWPPPSFVETAQRLAGLSRRGLVLRVDGGASPCWTIPQ